MLRSAVTTHSSISLASYHRLFDGDLFSSRAICLMDDPLIERLRRTEPARWRIRLTRLEVDRGAPGARALMNSMAYDPNELARYGISDGLERTIGDALLFDARSIDRVMCV